MSEGQDNFTTWKIELEDTVNADPKLGMGCLKVLRAYLNFMNGRDARPFCSIIDLRVATAMSERTVTRARQELVEAGYFIPMGRTASGAVRYRIVNAGEKRVQDHVTITREALREIDGERRRLFRAKRKLDFVGTAKFTDPTGPEVRNFNIPRSVNLASNTVEDNRRSLSKEKREPLKRNPNSYALARDGDHDPFPIPETDLEAVTLIDALCTGRSVGAKMRNRLETLLRSGALTPDLARNIIGNENEAAA